MTIPYRQHLFKQNGKFTIAHVPPGGYFDVLLVGGGANGTGSTRYTGSIVPGGAGGEVVYKRVYVNSPRVYDVTVGQGGNRSADARPSSISGDLGIYGSTAIAAGGPYRSPFSIPSDAKIEDLDSTLGTLITDGLFYDNTEYYGGKGSSIGNFTNTTFGDYGKDNVSGGAGKVYITQHLVRPNSNSNLVTDIRYNGEDGAPNTGGGGGAASNETLSLPLNSVFSAGITGSGGSGIVIIRYPILK